MRTKMIEEYTKHSAETNRLLRTNPEREINEEVEKLKEKLVSLKRGEKIIDDAISAGAVIGIVGGATELIAPYMFTAVLSSLGIATISAVAYGFIKSKEKNVKKDINEKSLANNHKLITHIDTRV